MNNIKKTAEKLQQYGRNGDTMLAHITPQEADVLKRMGGSGTINPDTGLPEYFLGAIAGPVMSLAGGLLGGSKSADAAKGQAEALRAAADKAAAMAAFTPYGMTTAFGTSKFTDKGEGSYTLSPELKAQQEKLFAQMGAYDPTQVAQSAQSLYGGANQVFGAGNRLFGVGEDYLATSPEQARQDYMSQQQALYAGTDEQRLAALRNQTLQTGRSGLATGGTSTGMAATNPEMAAYYNSLAQRDRQLAADAEQAAQQRQTFGINALTKGAGLFGVSGELMAQVPKLTTAGYAPLEAQLGLLKTTESMGQDPYKLSIDLANQYAQAGARQGQLYLQPQQAAANAYAQYQGYSPMSAALSGAGSALSGMSGGGLGGASSWFSNLLGGGNTPQADSGRTANLFSGSSAYNQMAGWSA